MLLGPVIFIEVLKFSMRHVTFERGFTMKRKYGCLSFIFDAIMVVVTGGFWLIWIFVREMRK